MSFPATWWFFSTVIEGTWDASKGQSGLSPTTNHRVVESCLPTGCKSWIVQADRCSQYMTARLSWTTYGTIKSCDFFPFASKRLRSKQRSGMSGPQVPRAPLGNTGVEVPVIGFGASPLGGVFEVRCTNLDYPVSHSFSRRFDKYCPGWYNCRLLEYSRAMNSHTTLRAV
jgi:hypothetical protein